MKLHYAEALTYWIKNPVEAVKDWFHITPEDYQADIIHSLLSPDGANRVVAKSAHGVGKTTTLALVDWVYLMTRPKCRVVATAPTQSQLKDILWPEVAKWGERMPEQFRGMWEISETHVRHKEFPKTWFAVARTSNRPENLQGFHNDNILINVDEASGVAQNIFEVIEGTLSEAEQEGREAKFIMTGNPTQVLGEFYNAFHKNKGLYARYTISGDDMRPKDKNGGRIYVSSRVTEAYRKNMARKYGRNSAVYDVRVRGLFPSMSDNTVIPLAWAEAAQYVTLPVFDRVSDPYVFSMDVSRMGADETVLACFRRGHCLWMKTWPKTSTGQCVDIIADAVTQAEKEGISILRFIVDEPGIGGGVIDAARRANLPVIGYHGGASPTENSGDPEEDVRRFINRRARDWWHVRLLLERNQVHIPNDETLVNQLASVQYEYNDRDKVRIESKGNMRDRLGEDASPDRADALVMGLAPFQSLTSGMPMDLLTDDDEIIFGELMATATEDMRGFS